MAPQKRNVSSQSQGQRQAREIPLKKFQFNPEAKEFFPRLFRPVCVHNNMYEHEGLVQYNENQPPTYHHVNAIGHQMQPSDTAMPISYGYDQRMWFPAPIPTNLITNTHLLPEQQHQYYVPAGYSIISMAPSSYSITPQHTHYVPAQPGWKASTPAVQEKKPAIQKKKRTTSKKKLDKRRKNINKDLLVSSVK